MEPFDLRGFIEVAQTQLLFLIGLVTGIVTAAGKFGVSGRRQLLLALIVGALLGAIYFVASWGLPATVAMGLSMLITMLVVALVPIGAYELVFKPLREATKQ